MPLNFPPSDASDGNPTNGMRWTAPNGYEWVYDSTIPGWKSIAPTGNSNIVYRGGIDLTRNPNTQFDDIISGNQFAVVVGADPVDEILYPGLGGENIQEGQIVLFDGNEWQYINNVPYATEDVAGIVELATEEEALDRDNHRVVLTPMRGNELIDHKVPQATIELVGKTRYATQKEARQGIEESAALTPHSIQTILDRIDKLERDIVPPGTIAWFAAKGQYLPVGWLQCDGQRIYRDGETKVLFELLREWGNPWGPDEDSFTVRLPDLRGRFIRGYHDGSGRDPDKTGFGKAQGQSFERHTHEVNDPGHDHDENGYPEGPNDQSTYRNIVDRAWRDDKQKVDTQDSKTRISLELAGGNETRPKNINLTPMIKL